MELTKEKMLEIAERKEKCIKCDTEKHICIACDNFVCANKVWREEVAFYEHVGELLQANAEGRLLVLPCKVGDAIDKLFSHNEIIALWYKTQKDRDHSYLLWKGEAWSIPKKYKKQRILKFFGTIPEKITESDTLNLLVTPYLRPCNEDEMQEGENDG